MRAAFVLIALVIPTVPASANGSLPVPTQEEAQRVFDAAVSRADHVIVEHIWFKWTVCPPDMRRIAVTEISSEKEIQALSQYIRLKISPPVRKVVDGREVLEWEMPGAVDAPGCFSIELQKGGKALLVFRIYDYEADLIGSEALLRGSTIKVEKEALAPFYNRLTELREKREANKPVQTTTTAVTPAAAQPAHHP